MPTFNELFGSQDKQQPRQQDLDFNTLFQYKPKQQKKIVNTIRSAKEDEVE